MCPHCMSPDINKSGNVNGEQRYKCKRCNKTFIQGSYMGGNKARPGSKPVQAAPKPKNPRAAAYVLFAVAGLFALGAFSFIPTNDLVGFYVGVAIAAVLGFIGFMKLKKQRNANNMDTEGDVE